jgi:aspartate carbamoyltransferase catalytic subunit
LGNQTSGGGSAVGSARVRTIRSLIADIGIEGCSLISINDLTNDQIYRLFDLARVLEPWNRSRIELLSGNVMCTLFFQPSTRTRMSFETAMHRLGGDVVAEATPLLSSAAAKEESLPDMLTVISRYANIIVLRHPDDVDARDAVRRATVPVINGGFGNWEHPTQALLDLYTLWRVAGRIDGLSVCIASPDLAAARTGHSMAYGLSRLGARVVLATRQDHRTPPEVMARLREIGGAVEEVFDLDQASFKGLASSVDLVYLPGCSAPKGVEADDFKRQMAAYFLRHETVERVRQEHGRLLWVTHTLPRREGEMDTRLDDSPSQLYFEAIGHSVSIRMALIAAVLA